MHSLIKHFDALFKSYIMRYSFCSLIVTMFGLSAVVEGKCCHEIAKDSVVSPK